MDTVVSGIRSTGNLHLGNYFGALKNFLKCRMRITVISLLPDYHALTTHPKPQNFMVYQQVLAEYLAVALTGSCYSFHSERCSGSSEALSITDMMHM